MTAGPLSAEFPDFESPARRVAPPSRSADARTLLWADEGAAPRQLEFRRQRLNFEDAIEIDKIDALLAWHGDIAGPEVPAA